MQGSSAPGPGSQAFDRHHSSGLGGPKAGMLKAQLAARGLQEAPFATGIKRELRYYVPSLYADPNVDSETWAAHAVVEVNTSVAKTGNHVCRAEVCHKGRISLP